MYRTQNVIDENKNNYIQRHAISMSSFFNGVTVFLILRHAYVCYYSILSHNFNNCVTVLRTRFHVEPFYVDEFLIVLNYKCLSKANLIRVRTLN